MSNVVISAAAAVLLAGCAAAPPVTPSASRSLVSPGLVPVRTIVIDAGHGGKDPGTSHYGLREKDLTLDITRRLKAELTASGFSVMMTRDHDEFLALSRRPAVANRSQADLFVSVHANANRQRQVSGVEVYYPRQSVIGSSMSLPPRIDAAEVDALTTTVRQVLWDVVLSRSRRESSAMARHICRALQARLGAPCRGTRGARFVVLREAWMPSVLVEVGYVSNRKEAQQLGRASYRQLIAKAIAEGLVSYANRL
ncbi:MAG: N-acetylmuramoyl-L-alanine amidase [Candidatus Omnitrophica bacterium]|nr:N-acetylmuramoyl-L-alanine amidase [Candidatus Omnitrophota bacterium]